MKKDNKNTNNKLKAKKSIKKNYSYLPFAVASVLSGMYGVVVFMVHSGTAFFLIWFVIAAVFALLSFMAYKHAWKKVKKPIKVICVVFLALGILFEAVTQGMIISQFNAKGVPDLDYIIVLGSQVKKNGPSVVTVWRLKAAIEYMENNPDTKAIVSGGQGYNEPAPEAVIMKQYMVENGIDPDRILTEEKSTNTAENIAFSAKLLDKEHASVGIVTSNYHVFRGVALAKHYGYKNVCGIAGMSAPRYLPNNMLRESCGIAKDFVFGNI